MRAKAQRAQAQRRHAAGPGARRARQLGAMTSGPHGAGRELREREPPRAQGEREAARHLRRVPAAARSRREPFERWLAQPREAPERRRARRPSPSSPPAPATTTTRGPRERRARARAATASTWCAPSSSAAASRTSTAATSPRAQAKARFNVASLLAEIEQGRQDRRDPADVLVHDQEGIPRAPRHARGEAGRREHARPDAVLEQLRREKTLNRDFQKGLGKVAYHAACHLRAQKIGFPGARVLGVFPDTEVEVDREVLRRRRHVGDEGAVLRDGAQVRAEARPRRSTTPSQTVVTDCPLSALRIAKENGVPVLHPVEALAEAYGIARRRAVDRASKEATR